MNKEKYKKGEEERNIEQEQQGEVREGRRQKHFPPTVLSWYHYVIGETFYVDCEIMFQIDC